MAKSDKIQKLHEARAEVVRLWELCCAYDGIDPGVEFSAVFAVFSLDNPHVVEYDAAVAEFNHLFTGKEEVS